ncbi:MAG: hypothetical protein ABJL67_15835 [Sulfitobacter sp.]
MILSSGGSADALTADDVLNKMSDEQRHGYVSGMVDAFAFARWQANKPDKTGMQCIYNWYYSGDADTKRKIYAWFERHLDKHADALLFVLVKKECGE